MQRDPAPPRPVALLLPGQGAQYERMALGLYGYDFAFTAAIDNVFDLMGERGKVLRADWQQETPAVGTDHVTRSAPLLFAIDYALGSLVMSWGIRPAAVLGHSVGELAAAVLAGIVGLADAARLVCERAARMSAAPPGGMLAVAACADELRGYLIGDVAVGAVNAPRQTVLAGPDGELAAVEAALRADGYVCRRVPATTAFHSPVLADLAAADVPLLEQVPMRPPDLAVYSAYVGGRLTDDIATSPAFWAGQPAAPVLFWQALDALLSAGDFLLVEAGPGDGLASLARRHPAVATGRSGVLGMLATPRAGPAADRGAVAMARRRLRGEGYVLPAAEPGQVSRAIIQLG